MKLIFIRHGETSWNVDKRIQGSSDIELNENGEQQAEDLGFMLKNMDIKIQSIYSSKQKRAKQTAEVIAKHLNLEYEIMSGLEEMNLGLWEGKTWEQIEIQHSSDYKTWFKNRRFTNTPQGESYQDLLDRLLPCLRKIIDTSSADVLIVTHSAVIMTLLAYLYDTSFDQMSDNYRMKNTEMVEVSVEEFRNKFEYIDKKQGRQA